MDKCKNCSNEFQYKEVLKSIWNSNHFYSAIECKECNTKNYSNFSTRATISFLGVFPIVIFNIVDDIFGYIEYKSVIVIIFYAIWVTLVIRLTPYFARYHIKSEKPDKYKALLVSDLNSMESEIITSILESYDIPYLKKTKGISGVMEIYSGSNYYGVDIYVQPEMLEIAKELINPENIEDEQNS